MYSITTVFPSLVVLPTFILIDNVGVVELLFTFKKWWRACRFSISFSNAEYIALNKSNGFCSWSVVAVYRPPPEYVTLI